MTDVLLAAGAAAGAAALFVLVPALLLTLVVEVPVAWAMGLRGRRPLTAVILVNLITNPLVNYVVFAFAVSYPELAQNTGLYYALVAVLEVLVVIAEWRLLLWVLGGSSRRLLLTSLVMNAASFGIGAAILWLFPFARVA
jgi:hypothetical protein